MRCASFQSTVGVSISESAFLSRDSSRVRRHISGGGNGIRPPKHDDKGNDASEKDDKGKDASEKDNLRNRTSGVYSRR